MRSLELAGIGKDGNVWAELGGVWREVMKKPTEAAHVIGKLLKHLGEDRILWGTDGIWFGSPQDQIQAFRAFEIPVELQEKHGYPALTREAKAKIFGLNAARVYGVEPDEIRQVAEGRRRLEGAPGVPQQPLAPPSPPTAPAPAPSCSGCCSAGRVRPMPGELVAV